ncbi:MAG TPA: hypothetical protein PKW15_00095 [Alphaproteobacteria bacterium]|nr:hypothetical protein [Rhodospirillaceae bacterium]HRJ11624.1 hypothetical protein [Alphaproteobacteria bacterium]
MSLFRFLRWSENNRRFLRILDYALGGLTVAFGIWQDSWLSIIIGVVFILAALFNLSERVNFFLPRIVPGKKDRDV